MCLFIFFVIIVKVGLHFSIKLDNRIVHLTDGADRVEGGPGLVFDPGGGGAHLVSSIV